MASKTQTENSNAELETKSEEIPVEPSEDSGAVAMDKNTDDEKAEDTGESSKDEEKTSQEKQIDPYAYLNRDEFTSEIYKIEVFNLPKYFGITELRKRLTGMDLKPSKIKTVPKQTYAFVNFRCEEDRQKALEVIPGHKWKGRDMKVKKANPSADPLLKKRKAEADHNQSRNKAAKREDEDRTDIPIADRLNNVVQPWWKMPYSDQLQAKQKEMSDYIRKLGRQIEHNNFQIREWLTKQKAENDGLCCALQEIKPTPSLNGYRNKCEFTIGQNVDKTDKTVGFRLGRYRGGVVTVVEPTDVNIIPDSMKTVAKAVQKYLQTQSTKPGFDLETKLGNWRQVTVRCNREDDILVILHFHPQKLDQEEIDSEKQALKDYFESEEGQAAGITSLYFQVQSERISEELPCEHLLGKKYIHEKLLELNFRISPTAFFQVNTAAAEILYSTIADWCKITPTTTLLDICCGTGTIGLTMAKGVAKVIGIELCKEAADDAKINRNLNDIINGEVHCGKAEEVLPRILPGILRNSGEDIVAVVDPPRAGLHTDVVRTIRKHKEIQRLVYVSCNPPGAIGNIVDFTRSESRRMKGPAFKLIQAVAVDMFPQTKLCELVMLLER